MRTRACWLVTIVDVMVCFRVFVCVRAHACVKVCVCVCSGVCSGSCSGAGACVCGCVREVAIITWLIVGVGVHAC